MRSKPDLIGITVKLFSGLDRQACISDYDPAIGIVLSVANGTPVKAVLQSLGLRPRTALAVFVNGHKAEISDRLGNGDVLFCMKPVSGG